MSPAAMPTPARAASTEKSLRAATRSSQSTHMKGRDPASTAKPDRPSNPFANARRPARRLVDSARHPGNPGQPRMASAARCAGAEADMASAKCARERSWQVRASAMA